MGLRMMLWNEERVMIKVRKLVTPVEQKVMLVTTLMRIMSTVVHSSEVVVDSQPVFQCEFCERLENEFLTSKKHCRHLELVNEKLTARVLSREDLHDDDTKV